MRHQYPLRVGSPTMFRIPILDMFSVGFPPNGRVLFVLGFLQVARVAAVFLKRLQVFTLDLVIGHRTERGSPATNTGCVGPADELCQGSYKHKVNTQITTSLQSRVDRTLQ